MLQGNTTVSRRWAASSTPAAISRRAVCSVQAICCCLAVLASCAALHRGSPRQRCPKQWLLIVCFFELLLLGQISCRVSVHAVAGHHSALRQVERQAVER